MARHPVTIHLTIITPDLDRHRQRLAEQIERHRSGTADPLAYIEWSADE